MQSDLLQRQISTRRESRSSISCQRSLNLDECQKSWMLLSSQCHLNGLKALHKINHRVINDKSFISGYTALHWAAKKGNIMVLIWLCDNGANINSISHGGYSPIHLAAMHRKIDVINILHKKYGGSIDIRDNSGRKPSWYMPDHPLWAATVMKYYESRNSSSSSASSSEHVFVTSNNDRSYSNGDPRLAKIQPNDGQLDRFEKGVKRTMLSMAQSFRSKGRRRRQQPSETKETKNTEFRTRASTEASGSPRPRHLKSISAPSTPRTRHISIEHPHMGEKEGITGAYHLDPRMSPSADRNRRISEPPKTFMYGPKRQDINRDEFKTTIDRDSTDLKTKPISSSNGTAINNNDINYQSDNIKLSNGNHRESNKHYESSNKYNATNLSDSQNNWKSTTFV